MTKFGTVTWGGLDSRSHPCPHPEVGAPAPPYFLGPLPMPIQFHLDRPNSLW